ncbi:hypothetical protein CDL12_28357 [Handroanthus impetiginosus]|uniref:Myb-like domain-containing protein n=1 Tax=Handroanthus impetiginosus TaxID=429701 RepID=A0A2G9G1G8_9LAMI|nr:hypothetical protein CDL12_28357 [Handroanthus impetiginosus]
MRDTNFEEQKPTNTLRRSPRFLHENQIRAANSGTPKPAPRKIRAPEAFYTPESETQKNGDGISLSGKRKGAKSKGLIKYSKESRRSGKLDSRANLSSLELQKQYVIEKRVTRSSVRGSRFVYSQDDDCDEISGEEDGEIDEVKSSEKPGKGSRRSTRFDKGANVSKNDGILNQYVIEKRVTRSSVRDDKFVNNEFNESGPGGDCGERLRGLPREGKCKLGLGFCEQSIGITEKRVTRSSRQRKINLLVEKASNVPSDDKAAMLDERKPKCDSELSKPYVSKRDVKECGNKEGSEDRNCKRKMHIGEKRKRNQVEEECGIVQGWTKEQELALQRAYFTAKPTPHFWKKVAKMVPGKSAEDCFNRIHSDLLTPSQPRTRSRANRKKPSPLSFSASKLLSPAETKTKKLRSGRRKTLVSQKTVRQLLQKQQNEDQDYEADLFDVLEPSMDPGSLNFQEGAFASPPPKHGSSILTKCRETSSSAHKKHLSRLHSSQKAAFVSPPVLKQIKNKALHEKYIDQLHCRDAKRKAESLRNTKCIQDQNDKKFRSMQSSTNDDSDTDDNACCSDEGEDEDELR